MDQQIIKSGRDSLLLAIPLVAILFIGFFRLDQWFFRSTKNLRRRPLPARGVDAKGRPIVSDPDGRIPPRQ